MPELDSFLSLIGYLWGCSGNPGDSVLKWGLLIQQPYTMADITLWGVLVATEKAARRYDEQ